MVEDFEVKVSCFLGNSDIPEEDKCRYKPPEAWEVRVCGCCISFQCVQVCQCVHMHTCAHPCVLLYACSVVVSYGCLMFGVQLAMWS